MQWKGALQKALHLKPLAKTINPVIDRQSLLSHAKAMTALRIDVQFDRVVGYSPCMKQGYTWIHSQLIIIGESDKQWSCIGWDSDIFPKSTVNRGYEIRKAIRVVFKCHTSCDSATCREAHDANPVRGYIPLGSMLAYHLHGLFSVRNGERPNLPRHLPHLVSICALPTFQFQCLTRFL